MPTLLQINITANWGSTGKIAEQIGLSAMSKGWVSYIVYGRWANTSKSHVIKVGNKKDMYAHYLEQRIFDNEGLCSKTATRKLIKKIDEIKPDIIQLHNIHDHYLNYKILFLYLNSTNIKVVWTFHDCWAFTGHCFHFVTKGCEKWKSQCCQCPLSHEYPNTLFDRSCENYKLKKSLFTTNNNLSIVSCSDWIKGMVQQSFLKEKRVQVIHNGVDLNTYVFDKKKNTLKDFSVLAVSNVWNKDKGIDDIVCLRTLLPHDYTITLVGVSKEQKQKLPEGIVGIERTQNVQELVELYNSADVLINPTYADTFPTVNLEALACGTPVITYKTGGSPEAIDEKTGIVVEQGDVASLAEAIKNMRNNPLSSKDCRERAEKHFDKDKCFSEYIKLYEELLNK